MNRQTILEHRAAGNGHDEADQAESPKLPTAENKPSDLDQRRAHHYCHIRFEWPKVGLEIVTILLVGFYAFQAWRQADSSTTAANAAHDAAVQAQRSNDIAHENAMTQLRAYVNLGIPNGRPIDLIQDEHTHRVTDIKLNFRNAGNTPALHLAVRSLRDIQSGERIPFRTRFWDVYNGIGGMVTGGLGLEDLTVPPEASVSVSLPTDAKAIDDTLARFRIGKVGKPSEPLVIGFYEYCDVFGVYHCDAFSYQLVFEPVPHFVDSYMSKIACRYLVRPEDPALYYPKGYGNRVTPYPRCEQPDELMTDQGPPEPQTKK